MVSHTIFNTFTAVLAITMGKQLPSLTPELKAFIQEQKLFFVGTARADGRVNISPKGLDTLRVLDQNKVIWLNLTGSGNETAAHLLVNNRMTLMFCAFEGKPLILRLYGTAEIYHPKDEAFKMHAKHFAPSPGSRQIIEMKIDLVQSSCGFAVPLMNFVEERSILNDWAQKQGQERIENYWADKNVKSIDGFDTGMSQQLD